MKKGWLDKYTEIADGGTTISGPTILSRQDLAYKSYQDSLNLYKAGTELLKLGRDNPFFTNADYDRINNKYVSNNPANNIGSNKGPHIDAVDYQMIGDVNNPYRQGVPLYKKPTNPPTIAQILKLKSKGITSTEKKLIPRETPQFSKPIDKSLVRTEKQWLNKNTYNGESEGDYLLNFYDDDSVEKTPYKKMQTGGKKEKISTSIPYEKYNQKNITPKQALTQEALQYIFGNPSENYNPQPIEQVPNDATNRQPYISKQQAEQISKDVRNPYYGSPNYHVPVKEYSISPDKQENKMDNELAERIKKEEEKHTQWDRIHYGSKTAINLANMFTAGTIPPLAYSAGAMDAWDAGMDYSEGNYTGAMNNATGALLNILPQTLGLNTRSFTPSTNSYATARWWKNNPSALVAPTTITPNLIDYANRGLGLSTQYVNPALNAFVNNKLNIRGVQTPITGKLASDIGLSVDDAYKTIHKNGGEVNYNNSNVSLPEGFVGIGNDTSGRNYSPAWGGQFQNGGWTSKYISEDKFLQPNSEKLPTGYKIPNRDPSSELAMSIGGEDGEPAYLIPSFKYGQPLEDPLKEYRETGDYLGGPFKTWQEADDWDINVRHPYVEKNQAIPFPIRTKGKDMQMGGVLPSAFVRTGDIPSEGKYAKKTMPSAQNGKEMQFYQHGLDWKPNNISQDGIEIPLDILARQAYKESGFNSNVINKKSNAKGLVQLKEDAIKDYLEKGKSGKKTINPLNSDDAIAVQKWYMNNLYNADFINKPNQDDKIRQAKTLAAYNWGRGNLSKKLTELKDSGYDIYNDSKWIEQLPTETKDYVNKILYNNDKTFNSNYDKAFNNNLDLIRKYVGLKPGEYTINGERTNTLKSGGQIKTDNRGYWNPKNWGHPVRINSNNITMEGVDQPLWGISDTGDTKYMEPGQDYRFKGKSVTEYPMARNGINNLDEKTTEHLDQLTNFTNYNKPTVGGWLSKYSQS
jgi:hypothetical protein